MFILRNTILKAPLNNFLRQKGLTSKITFFKRGSSNKRQEKPAFVAGKQKENTKKGEKFEAKLEEKEEKKLDIKGTIIKKLKTYPSILEQDDIMNSLEGVFQTPEQTFISNISKSDTMDSSQWQKMRKNLKLYPSTLLIKLTSALANSSFKNENEVWEPLQSEFSRRLHTLSLEEIAQIMVEFAFVNRHDRAFFRQIENELHDREDMDVINIRLIEKFLYGFSYSNHGSSLIYNKIAKTIKIAQTEISPMKLALFANYFSRATESIKGGFGVYQIAEKRIHERLIDFSFHELCKISQLLLPQNIGSNAFYKDLENNLLEKFPPGNEITVPDLVALCKATSTFHFQNSALFHKLQDISINYMENASNSQIENLLWAFSRAKRGSTPFYEKIDKEIAKRSKLLRPRGLAFAFESLSRMSKKFDVSKSLSALEGEIQARINEFKVHSHYLVKILRGLKETRGMTGPLFRKVTEALFENNRLKFSEIVEILLVLGDHKGSSDPESRNEIFKNFEQKLEASVPFLKSDQICSVYYAYTAANAWKNPEFFKIVSNKLPEALAVPKHLFCQTMWAAVQTNRVYLASEFVRIINNLLEFGDIRFFFDHDNFVKLSWSSIVIHHIMNEDKQNSQEQFHSHYWSCVKEAILDINPNTLQTDSLRLWLQVLNMLSSVVEVEAEITLKKAQEVNEFLSNELKEMDQNNSISDGVRKNLAENVESLLQTMAQRKKFSVSTSYLDERKNYLDVSIAEDNSGRAKVGIRILSRANFLLGIEEPEYIYRDMETEIRILENMGWKMLVLKESFWVDMGDTQKHLFLKEQLGSLLSLGQEQKVNGSKVTRRRTKPK